MFFGWSIFGWRRLLRVPWTARRSNQSNLNEISPEYSLEGLMLKLKLKYFGHLMRRADSFEKTLMLGKIEGKRRRGMTKAEVVRWHHWLNGHEFKQIVGDGNGWGSLACCSSWSCTESDTTERLNNKIRKKISSVSLNTAFSIKTFTSCINHHLSRCATYL